MKLALVKTVQNALKVIFLMEMNAKNAQASCLDAKLARIVLLVLSANGVICNPTNSLVKVLVLVDFIKLTVIKVKILCIPLFMVHLEPVKQKLLSY